jgi:hypothetical protein
MLPAKELPHPGRLPDHLAEGAARSAYTQRHAALRAASAQPLRQHQLIGSDGMLTPAGASRALGRTVEEKLREGEHVHPWHYDPLLPLEEVQDGLPDWQNGVRPDNGETAGEFHRLVDDYVAAMEKGMIFPPLLVMEVTPAADRAALGWLHYRLVCARMPPAVPHDHFKLLNGRHRMLAAQALGRTTHPAFCWSSWAEISWPRATTWKQWQAWVQRALAAEDAVCAEAAAGRQRAVQITNWDPDAAVLHQAIRGGQRGSLDRSELQRRAAELGLGRRRLPDPARPLGDYPRMPTRLCVWASAKLAQTFPELTEVSGYLTWIEDGRTFGMIHCWNVREEDGVVVDAALNLPPGATGIVYHRWSPSPQDGS